MATHPTGGHSGYELLQDWRRLERELEAMRADDPHRPDVEQQRDDTRHRYLQHFDAETGRQAKDAASA